MMSQQNLNEIAAYKIVDDALQSYPLAEPPPEFVATVINHLPPTRIKPRFRLDWFDYAITFFTTGMAALFIILWRMFPLVDLPTQTFTALNRLPHLSSVAFIIIAGFLAGIVAISIAAATLSLNRSSLMS